MAMPRIRTIKPEFHTHEGLAGLSPFHRLLFIGLWNYSDRAGRLRDKPKLLKLQILPWDDVDVDQMLSDLAEHEEKFIVRYEVEGRRFIQVNNFLSHQCPLKSEGASKIQPPPRDVPPTTLRQHPDNTPTSQRPCMHDQERGTGNGEMERGTGNGERKQPSSLSRDIGGKTDDDGDDLAPVVSAIAEHFPNGVLDPKAEAMRLREMFPGLALRPVILRAAHRARSVRPKSKSVPDYLRNCCEVAERDRYEAEKRAESPPGAAKPGDPKERLMASMRRARGAA